MRRVSFTTVHLNYAMSEVTIMKDTFFYFKHSAVTFTGRIFQFDILNFGFIFGDIS